MYLQPSKPLQNKELNAFSVFSLQSVLLVKWSTVTVMKEKLSKPIKAYDLRELRIVCFNLITLYTASFQCYTLCGFTPVFSFYII